MSLNREIEQKLQADDKNSGLTKKMPITGIEPWTSCLRGERSTNIATTDYNEHYLTNRFLLSVDQSQDFTNCATTTANEKSLAIGI